MIKFKKRTGSLIIAVAIIVMTMMGMTGCSGSKSADFGDAVTNTESVDKEQTVKLEKATIYVFAAASLKNSMVKIQELYKNIQPDITVVFNTDSSGTLKTQIEEGAECDIFFPAAMKQMSDLNAEGYIESASISKILQNQVVLIKPRGSATQVTGFDTIIKAKNIALAGEDVPVGAYAREIFKNIGIFDKVMLMEINQGSNVTAVLAAVAEGSNEIGIVYATDAASVSGKVDIIAAAPASSLSAPVIYPAGLVKNSNAKAAQTAAAKDFIRYIQSQEAMNVFSQAGFSRSE